jgi:plasmid maintenance system antidote protein VapI
MSARRVQVQKSAEEAGLDIKHELLDRGMTVADLARQIRRPRPTVSAAIHNPDRFPLLRAAIEKALRG